MVATGIAAVGAASSIYSATQNHGSNSGGGPSGGALQSSFGTPNQIYTRNPDWVNQASQTNYTNASTAANQPYQAYTGQQVAPLNQNELIAQGNAANGVGRFAPTYGTITNYLNQSAAPNTATYNPTNVGYSNVGTQTWDANAANQYMSPYLQASLQPQINNINQDYALRQNANNAAAAGAGSFGGDRAAVNSALLTKQQQDEINGVTAQGYNTAYNTGLGAFQTAQNQSLQAQQANQNAGINTGEFNQTNALNAFNTNQNTAQQNRQALQTAATDLTGLTGQQQSNTNSIQNNLLATGQLGQQTQQAQDTADYQNYLNQLYYPEQQASYLQGLLGNSANAGSLSAQNGAIGQNGASGLAGSLGTILGTGQSGSAGILGSLGGVLGGSGSSGAGGGALNATSFLTEFD